MLRLHVALSSNEITLVGYRMKSDLSCQSSDNQETTDIKLSLTDYKRLFHLMLRLHVASISNEITLVGYSMEKDLLPTGIMSVPR